ncbi:MAG: sigma-70 family RNA polymerase sigma factor [Planctomycetes bacterium]|nr:sigma-70 family RNA polymerase sigma factor [Planctomycetota bacterium]
MRCCAEGDVDAFEGLYDRYARRIMAFTLRMTGNTGAAESLAQETFLRVLKNAPSYSYPRRFSSWIYAIARNICLDFLRKKRPVLRDNDPAATEAAANKSPLATLIQDEEEQRLAEAIQVLPDEFREVLILRTFQDLSYFEIAEVVGCNESTARSRMDYALRDLRKSFHKKDQESQKRISGDSV